MADIWSRLGITPYEADPSKVKLKLGDDLSPAPAKQAPKIPNGTIFTQDGFIPDVLRTMGDNGLNYMNMGAHVLNVAGANIDTSKIVDAINATRTAQDESDMRTMSPTRKAETEKIKAQLSNANGVVDNIIAGGNAGVDMLMHPIDNAGKIVGSLFDPLNVASFGAGTITAKVAAKLGGNRLARTAGAATAGAVTNAPVNAIQEGSFAAGRGEDWEKAAQAAAGGGAVGGTIMGGIPGIISHPHMTIDPNAPIKEPMDSGIDLSGNPKDTVRDPNGNYHAFNAPEVYDPSVDIGISRAPHDIEGSVHQIASKKLLTWAQDQEVNAHTEAAQSQAAIQQMLSQNIDTKTIHTALDNIITPSAEDVHITRLLNDGKQLPSRMSGLRLLPMLENSIKVAQEAPQIARTNQEFEAVLKDSGVSKDLLNVLSAAYAAKDPELLRDHIYNTLYDHKEAFVDHGAIRDEVTAQANHYDNFMQDFKNQHNSEGSLSQKLHSEMVSTIGKDQADAGISLIEGRAKAMGISADELIHQSGIRVEDMRDISGNDFVMAQDEADQLYHGVRHTPEQKEKRGVYNVQFNGKRSTAVLKDWNNVDTALKYEQGMENPVSNKGFGALHIEKHIGSDKDGWVSKEELLHIGDAVRKVTPYEKDGKRVYEYHNDAGDRFRVIVGKNTQGESVISFYSNRKAGIGNNTLTYIYPSSPEIESLSQTHNNIKLSTPEINAMVGFGFKNDGEIYSAIRLFSSSDVSSLPHELFHVFERTMNGSEKEVFDKAFGSYAEGTNRSEAGAEGFVKWLSEGKSPTPELAKVFEKFSIWLRDLWETLLQLTIKTNEGEFKLTDSHREFYWALMGDHKTAQKIFNSDIISKDSKTILKGGESGEAKPISGDASTRSKDTAATEIRSDGASDQRGTSGSGDGAGDGSTKSPSDALRTVRSSKQDLGDNIGNDAVPQSNERMDRYSTAGSDGTDISATRSDTLVPSNDRSNFDLNGKAPITLTKGERKKINSQAKAILDRGAPYTDGEKEILRQYTGEGGLESSKASLTQHYTPYETIRSIYKAIDDAGVNPKTALEPAVGSGNFVGHRPGLDWTTIDIDKTNHDVVNALYPKAKNYHNGFEEFKGKGFDLIISNVPFLEERGAGQFKDRPDIKMLHDYYFAAAMDKVNDNGIVAFVTSKGTMDKADSKVRKEVISKGDIIGAYRLPGGTFSKNTHTDVVTDVIFIQKRPDGVEPREDVRSNNEAFISSTKSADDIYLNNYFQQNTSHILGDIKAGIDKSYGRPAYEISGVPDYSRMKIDFVPYGEEKASAHEAPLINSAPTDSKAFDKWATDNGIEVTRHDSGGVVIDGDKVMVRKTIEMSDVDSKWHIYEPMENKTTAKKIAALDAIREAGERGDLEMGMQLIDGYKKEFKIHPKKDKVLGKILRAADASPLYHEFNSFFNEAFEPSDIFREDTRYSGSGKQEISAASPLHDRMFHYEDNKGEVNIKSSDLIDPKEFHNIIKMDEYAYTGGDTFQNSILYYSGSIYDKLDAIAKLREKYGADPLVDEKLKTQEKQLESIMPTPKKIDEISFKGVEKWISDAGIPIPFRKIEKWEKLPNDGGQKRTVEWESNYGKVFDNYLNSKQLISMLKDESMASFKNRLREAQQEVGNILDKHRESISRAGHTETFERAYNKRFNGYVEPDYLKASYMIQETLDALPSDLSLRSNQIRWIMQAYYEGKGINAHDVGGGKTLAGVVLAKVLKDKGVAKKPVFVVPSKVIKNWVKEIQRAVPDARIVDLGNLPKEKREGMLYDLANKNADYILISKEGFETLKLPRAVEHRYARELLNENLRNDDLKGRASKVMEEKVDKYLSVLDADNKNGSITIDKLGIDAIFADEARSYKNIGVSSELVGNKLGKAFGMNINDKTGAVSIDSATAYDFRFKTRYISERNNGRNIFLLDATPTPNKPIEIYTMLKHLDNKIFDEYGIDTDRDFANMFFEFGIKPTKTGGMDKGLIALKNAYGLKGIMNRYINRISMKQFADQKIIDLPEEKVMNHYLDQSDEGDMVFDDISRRMAEAKKDKEKRKEVPGIFSNGITASVDPRLYQRMGIKDILDPTPENLKLEKISALLLDKRSRDPKAGQIVFLDSAGHTASKEKITTDGVLDATLDKNLHQAIKDKLMESGKYKAHEIAILSGQEITDPKSGKEIKATGNKAQQLKQDIVDAYDAGAIKVIIGTTKSAGEGMNIQRFTTDIYHVDLPWTIAEVIQRNGRGVRYGNQNSSVNLHYFFQSGTFDSLMYKTVMNKKGWNEALWDSKVEDRMEVVDEGGSMPTPAEIMLAMEKDPIKRRQLELEIDHQRLSDEYNTVSDEVKAAERKITTLQRENSDEKIKQRELEEKMKDPYPTKELRELAEKVAKNKKLQPKFDETLARVRKTQEEYHARRIERMERNSKEIARREELLKKAKENLNTVTHDLHLFEDKFMDDKGNFISEVEC